ncbi:conserved hypothetical protein [Vibrio mimicus VM603]|uniref:Uncharacterized protein n=1 Tax=Vibrio mimicus VM603 TaxID=671074 RepID=D2YC80_VIBMI|nr:conserved hypothetical protein [Vibrio mimicus VM603]
MAKPTSVCRQKQKSHIMWLFLFTCLNCASAGAVMNTNKGISEYCSLVIKANIRAT